VDTGSHHVGVALSAALYVVLCNSVSEGHVSCEVVQCACRTFSGKLKAV
jgi:hypothetical protein